MYQQPLKTLFLDILTLKTKACFVTNLIYFIGKFYIHRCKFSNNKPIFI